MSNLLTASPVHAQDVIKVGGNFELSGPAASYGTQMDKGARLAIKHVNESGGVLGQQVEYVVYDNRSDTTETASIARRLVDEGVVGVVGPATSGDTLAQMLVLDQAPIPYVSGSATLDNITYNVKGELYEYFFRVVEEVGKAVTQTQSNLTYMLVYHSGESIQVVLRVQTTDVPHS